MNFKIPVVIQHLNWGCRLSCVCYRRNNRDARNDFLDGRQQMRSIGSTCAIGGAEGNGRQFKNQAQQSGCVSVSSPGKEANDYISWKKKNMIKALVSSTTVVT